MYPQYQTEWVKSLPEVCPKCEGNLANNSFTDKKGKYWESVKCDACQIKYIKSGGFKKETNGSAMLVDEVLAGLKKIDQRLDDMAEWFAEKEKELLKKLEK